MLNNVFARKGLDVEYYDDEFLVVNPLGNKTRKCKIIFASISVRSQDANSVDKKRLDAEEEEWNEYCTQNKNGDERMVMKNGDEK